MERYLPFARKYRPRFFREVVGQEVPVRILKNSIRLNRISHAYIFAGPRGVGKTTIARILAKALNCLNIKDSEPCGICENCQLIDKGNFPDLIEIDAASNRGIDDIRTIREAVAYTPIKGRYKIYILDEAHMLTKEAFNALLKTLEEPPPSTIFILCTTEMDRVPPTIISRCQRLIFSKVTEDKVVEYLKRICTNEGIEYEEDALYEIARASEGCMRDAASLLDQASSYGEGKVNKEILESLIGILSIEKVREFLSFIIEGDIERAVGLLDEYYLRGINLLRFWEQLINEVRNILLYKSVKDTDRFFGGDTRFYERYSKVSTEALLYLENILSRSLTELRYRDTVETLRIALIKSSIIKDIVPISKILTAGKFESVEKDKDSGKEGIDPHIMEVIESLESRKEGEKVVYIIDENVYKAFRTELEKFKRLKGNVEFEVRDSKKKQRRDTASLF